MYVVLLRVRTSRGLSVNFKLDLNRVFKVPEKLMSFEERTKNGRKTTFELFTASMIKYYVSEWLIGLD